MSAPIKQSDYNTAPAKFDPIDFIMSFENGELEDDEVIAGFQELVNNGMAYQLQGSYGRMADALIDAGLVTA